MKRFILAMAAMALLHVVTPATAIAANASPNRAIATFAGGCFWCVEAEFDGLTGVVSATSGYIGGAKSNPTYEQVSAGSTGHAEAVQIVFDPTKVSYARLVDIFWHNIDPLTANRQFCDSGDQYRSAIFYHDAEQRRIAETTKANIDKSKRFKKPVLTQIVAAGTFYPAEDYHQDYHLKNPVRYKYYKFNCGRAQRLAELWGKK